MVVVHSDDQTASDPAFEQVVADAERILAADARVTDVVAPRRGQLDLARRPAPPSSQAGAGGEPNDMVRAADDLKASCSRLGGDGVRGHARPARRACGPTSTRPTRAR